MMVSDCMWESSWSFKLFPLCWTADCSLFAGQRTLDDHTGKSRSVYLDWNIWRVRAVICSKIDEFVPHAQRVNLQKVRKREGGRGRSVRWHLGAYDQWLDLTLKPEARKPKLRNLKPEIRNPKPETSNPKLETQQPQLWTLNQLWNITPHYTSYTIHHTPCTIHHTPYTIHHTPYTINHSPCNIQH